MELGEIFGYIASAVGGGGLTAIINWRVNKSKAKAELKMSELEVIAQTVQTVYEPIIHQQNERIAQLDAEVKELRDEKKQMQKDYELQIAQIKEEYNKQIQSLEKRMLEISRAVGLKTVNQARSADGKFVKLAVATE